MVAKIAQALGIPIVMIY